MSNMEIYYRLRTPPPSALKKITGGRLKGMTDIRPQWRYEVLTEVFGICGIGWKYEVKDFDIQEHQGEKVVIATIALYIKVDGQWSEPIPGVGGALLVAKETSGLRLNDEAYKMAVTDALSVASKMIGVAADIYRGVDTSKYGNTSAPAPSHSDPSQPAIISANQLKLLMATASERGLTEDHQKAIVSGQFGFASRKHITIDKFDQVLSAYKSVQSVPATVEIDPEDIPY